jgi:hypothetical protein
LHRKFAGYFSEHCQARWAINRGLDTAWKNLKKSSSADARAHYTGAPGISVTAKIMQIATSMGPYQTAKSSKIRLISILYED